MTTPDTRFTPLKTETESLVDRVTNLIRESIIDGRLPPGEELSVSKVAKDLGVSQSPVREALERLSGQGLVLLRPARAAVVAPLTIDDIHEIFSLCRLIEVDACVRACPTLADEDIDELEHQLGNFIQAAAAAGAYWQAHEYPPDLMGAFWRAHDEFHLTMMRPVMGPRRTRVATQLWEARERYTRFDVDTGPSQHLLVVGDVHRALLEAARSRDPEQMRVAITEHLDFYERGRLESLTRRLATDNIAT